jgi:hypothetical protein
MAVPASYWPLMQNAIGADDKNALVQFILTADKFTNGPKVIEVCANSVCETPVNVTLTLNLRTAV